jgi:hypothetical protein
MVRWCGDGPPGAHVRDIRVTWDEPPEVVSDSTFEIRTTIFS